MVVVWCVSEIVTHAERMGIYDEDYYHKQNVISSIEKAEEEESAAVTTTTTEERSRTDPTKTATQRICD